ncbi:hypothetical protein M1S55_20115 (plasmid) [Acinetobacter baumannii]|nr:hypothetical protein [Acinetobacter baumannii]UQM35131.1 hypothetical protein M1S55_20115 [Acinetobacter baumannii]
MIDTRLLNEIKQHAMDCYPNEACGFIVVNKYKLALTIKCRNDSPFPKTQFLINPDEYLRAEQEGEICWCMAYAYQWQSEANRI